MDLINYDEHHCHFEEVNPEMHEHTVKLKCAECGRTLYMTRNEMEEGDWERTV